MRIQGHFPSAVLGYETPVSFLLPSDINSGKPYRVAYLYHGLYGSGTNFTDLTQLACYGRYYSVIFVMPDVLHSYYCDMAYGGKYFTYVTTELPKMCRGYFNISTAREDTSVIGISMGGFGALNAALTCPDTFGHCGAISAACLDYGTFFNQPKEAKIAALCKAGACMKTDFINILGDDLAYDPKYDTLSLAKSAAKGKIYPEVYSICGKSDAFLPSHNEFAKQMSSFYPDFTYETDEGCHNWEFFNKALQKVLDRFYGEK